MGITDKFLQTSLRVFEKDLMKNEVDKTRIFGTSDRTLTPVLSFIVTVFNRRQLVLQTLSSVQKFAEASAVCFEIIIVDDCSTDDSYEVVYEMVKDFQNTKLIKTPINLGATGAKNFGAFHCKGDWFVIVDSDDCLIPEVASEFVKLLDIKKPVNFFRCVDFSSYELIGCKTQESVEIHLSRLLNFGTPGECMPILPGWSFQSIPYDPTLRGCEGLTYAFLVKKFGPGVVHPLVVRRYRTENQDRLSSRKGSLLRAKYLARYNFTVLLEFSNELSVQSFFKYFLKGFVYLVYSIGQKVFSP